MKKYKVIALSVGGPGNKIYKSGDIVTEKNFREGRADELVKLCFLKEEKIEEENKTNPDKEQGEDAKTSSEETTKKQVHKKK